MTKVLTVCAMVLCVARCAPPPPAPAAGAVPGPTPVVSRIALGDLPAIDTARVLAHTKALSSDEYEGRSPGSRGESLTVAYLTEQLRAMGLRPGNTDGTYVQKVPLVGITPQPAPLIFRKGVNQRTLAWKNDVVAWSKHVAPTASLHDSELVFVGYGTMAPEFQWDDYKGLDVAGKTLVMLVNDPPVAKRDDPTSLDPAVFGGPAMTYYGRWTYKFEVGMAKKAAGVLLIHDTAAAGYDFDVVQAKVGEQFDLVTPDKNMSRVDVEGWISQPQARQLFQMAGQDFDALKARAATREFQPVSLGVTASMTIRNTMRYVDSHNVVARLEGRDARAKSEYVVYTAHWDHLGVGTAVDGDTIYNGAKDNAVGTAGVLEIAKAYASMSPAPKRSVLFLFVTAEEQGLLGSQYYAVSPIYPLAKTVAAINVDGLNIHGRTRDLTVIGLGASDLDDYVRDALGEQGRVVRPDAEPEKGFYYRSDHFNFAKRGVPALDPDEGVDFVGRPPEYGEQVRREWNERDYHQPSDIVRPDWNLDGAREDLQVLFAVGYRVADADTLPAWAPGNEFRAAREAMLNAGRP